MKSNPAELTPAPTHGIVLDIQRSAMNDGPGIRTTVFLKGCPLRCVWCHNPESWCCAPQRGVGENSSKQYGRSMSVEDIMAVVRRDIPFYRTSGGGLTISGGEPTFQAGFCLALLRAAKAEGIHTCLDTSGFCAAAVLDRLNPWVDLFLFDVKATGEKLHRRLTGASWRPIGDNLQRLLAAGAEIWLRCPLVPGVNDQEEHLNALAVLSREKHCITRLDLLPYHRSGIGKWRELGLEPLDQGIQEPNDETKRTWLQTLQNKGALGVHCG